MKLLNTTMLLMGILALSACYYDNEEELYPTSGGGCDTTNVTYSGVVKGIMDARCAVSGCHVSGAQTPDLSTYTGVKNNIDRVKVRALQEKTMPAASPLGDCDISKINTWINAGALNN